MTFVSSHGSVLDNSAAAAWTLVTTQRASAGNKLILAGTAKRPTGFAGISVAGGGLAWTNVAERTIGTTFAFIYCADLAADLPAGTAITITLAGGAVATTTSKTAWLEEHSNLAAGFDPGFTGNYTGSLGGTTNTPQTGNANASGQRQAGDLEFGVIAFAADSAATQWAMDPAWSFPDRPETRIATLSPGGGLSGWLMSGYFVRDSAATLGAFFAATTTLPASPYVGLTAVFLRAAPPPVVVQRHRAVPVERFSFVLCRSTGEPIGEPTTYQSRAVEKLLNGAASATVALDLTDPFALGIVPGQSRLKVFRHPRAGGAAVLAFYGLLPTSMVVEDAATSTITATYVDPRWILTRRYSPGNEVYTNVDQGAALWGLVATQNARATTYLRQGAIATGIIRTYAPDIQVVQTLIDDVCAYIDGPDVDVVPFDGFAVGSADMGLFTVYAMQGRDQPGVHLRYGMDWPSNVANIARTFLDVITYATFTGSSQTNVGLAQSYSIPGSPYGLLEDVQADPDVSTNATLLAKATGEVQANSGLHPVYTITDPTADAPLALEDFDVGDTIRLSVHMGRMVDTLAALRVQGIAIAIDQNGHESVTLTVA